MKNYYHISLCDLCSTGGADIAAWGRGVCSAKDTSLDGGTGCGYCLRVRPGDALTCLELLRSGSVPFSKVYGQTDSGRVEELPL